MITIADKVNKHIMNLFGTQIDQVTLGLLQRGFNFSISPRTIPKKDILCNIEYGIKDLLDNIKEIIRHDFSTILRKPNHPKETFRNRNILI